MIVMVMDVMATGLTHTVEDPGSNFIRLSFLEKMITILDRLDKGRIFTPEWVKIIKAQVETNKKKIVKMKQILKIA